MAKPGTFQPGADPRRNAGGRPKALKDVVEAARAHTVEAIEVLVAISTDDKQPGAARVSASVALLDRGWGKTSQPIEHSGDLTLHAGIAEKLGPARQRFAAALAAREVPVATGDICA